MAKKTKRASAVDRVEDQLYDYRELKKEHKEIKQEILYGTPAFENTGGGRSSEPSDPTARKAALLGDHRRLRHLELWLNAMEQVVFHEVSQNHQRLVHLRYWQNGGRVNAPDWVHVAKELNVGEATVYRWRKDVCERIAYLVGER